MLRAVCRCTTESAVTCSRLSAGFFLEGVHSYASLAQCTRHLGDVLVRKAVLLKSYLDYAHYCTRRVVDLRLIPLVIKMGTADPIEVSRKESRTPISSDMEHGTSLRDYE